MRAPRSGVFSAGNGSAMRAPVLGWEVDDEGELRRLVEISTTTTHTDPKAIVGALALAKTMHYCKRNTEPTREELIEVWRQVDSRDFWQAAVAAVEGAASLPELLELTGQKRGVGGYILHTVPVCLFVAEKHRDNFRAAVAEGFLAGGDTDTAAAITAALSIGFGGEPPEEWLKIVDYPMRAEPSLRRFCCNHAYPVDAPTPHR